MRCVPVQGRRLRSGHGNASLGQTLRPWHDSGDLSPLLFAQLAQICLHAGRNHGVQGAPRPASPSSGGRRSRCRQPFGEPFPFQARLIAHGSGRLGAAALPPCAASQSRSQGSAAGRAGSGVPGLGTRRRRPQRRAGISLARRWRPRPVPPPCWTTPSNLCRRLLPDAASAPRAGEKQIWAEPAAAVRPSHCAPPPRSAHAGLGTGDALPTPSPSALFSTLPGVQHRFKGAQRERRLKTWAGQLWFL